MIPLSPLQQTPEQKTWIDQYTSAGVRVVLKRALRAASIPFHDDESTQDLMDSAQKCGADVESSCDEWVELSDHVYGLTQMERFLMVSGAQQCLLMFRAPWAGR